MRKSVAAAVIAASAATSACGHSREEGAGPNVSRNYQLGNFQAIEVAGPYDVEVRTGGKPGVSAQGSEKLLERTVVEVRGDKLVIRPEEHHGWFSFGWSNNGKARFSVAVPQLSGATIAGSGDIRVDKVQGNRFEGTVAGSGGIDVATVDGTTFNVNNSNAATSGTYSSSIGVSLVPIPEPTALGLLGVPSYAVARELDNRFLDDYLRRFRESTGQKLLAKKGDFDQMESILASGGAWWLGDAVSRGSRSRGRRR